MMANCWRLSNNFEFSQLFLIRICNRTYRKKLSNGKLCSSNRMNKCYYLTSWNALSLCIHICILYPFSKCDSKTLLSSIRGLHWLKLELEMCQVFDSIGWLVKMQVRLGKYYSCIRVRSIMVSGSYTLWSSYIIRL